MSISRFFNKKARVAVAATTLAFGGVAGYQIGENFHAPQLSNFTLNAPDMTEAQFLSGKLAPGTAMTSAAVAAENTARESFTARIDVMAAEQKEYWQLAGTINQDRVIPSLPVTGMETRATALHASLVHHAVSFVSDLRGSADLSGQDYQALLADYDARVGFDVTALAGNYRNGVRFDQACQVAGAIGQMFSHDDQTDQQRSADVGSCMQEFQDHQDGQALEGAAGGLLIGGLFAVPLLRRRRNTGPQAFKSKPAK